MKNVASNLPARSGIGSCARVAPRSTATRFALLSLALLCVIALAACSDDDPEITFPTPPPTESKLWLYDVFGNSADDVYAGGYQGQMARFNGTSWTEVEMPGSQNVVSIWGEGDGTLYACGGGGSVWRNQGSGWNTMDSGTDSYLVGLGTHYGSLHVGGVDGALRKLTGNTWSDADVSMIVRDPAGAPTDTLHRKEDIASLVTVNHYFIGGAYRLDGWDPDENIGTELTDGMVIGPDADYPNEPEYGRFDWQLRPLRGDEIAASEWIQCSTSDDQILGNNYLGTSEGWVFKLSRNDENRLVWSKMYPRVTEDPRTGINDMWLDAAGNLYLVTHDGRIIFQTYDYNFVTETGYRVEHQVQGNSLMGLWAADAENIFMVGLAEKTVFRYRYDETARLFESVATDTLQFAGKSLSVGDGLDKFGRPLPE